MRTTSEARLTYLKNLLTEGRIQTQEGLVDALNQNGFEVSQSTISRDLRRVGAMKMLDDQSRTVYRLHDDMGLSIVLPRLVTNIQSNGTMIVIHTTPGSASLIAKHLDDLKPGGLLGTIAGDDTIFVAPRSSQAIQDTILAIQESIREMS